MAGNVKDYKMINVQLGDLSNAQSYGSRCINKLGTSRYAKIGKWQAGASLR